MKFGKDVEQSESLHTVKGNTKRYNHYGGFSKIKNRIMKLWSSHPASGYIHKRLQRRICKSYVHIQVHWNIIHKTINRWKQPNVHGYMKWFFKCHIHTTDYYLALKKAWILSHGTTWIDLEDIMLWDMRVTKKKTVYDFTDVI